MGSPRIHRRSRCPLAATLDIVGDRWMLVILRDVLRYGSVRFKHLLEADERIATNVLAGRLKRLEDAGLIRSAPYQENPPRLEYMPTEAAWALLPAIEALATWGKAHLGDVDQGTIDFGDR